MKVIILGSSGLPKLFFFLREIKKPAIQHAVPGIKVGKEDPVGGQENLNEYRPASFREVAGAAQIRLWPVP